MSKFDTARPQAHPAHADQVERAARLRDAAGRFAKRRETEAAPPNPGAMPAAREAPPRGFVPVAAETPEGAYALEIDWQGLGMHADPGDAIIVVPEMPTGAGLAVFYLKDKPGPVVFDLTHNFRPEFARPFKVGSEVVPLIEVVEPRTGRVGHLDVRRIEKIHRATGIYSAVDLPVKYGPRPTKLPILTECPEGMGEQYVSNASAYPLVRRGETVVYDPNRREPAQGALCVMEWNNGHRDLSVLKQRPVGDKGKLYWMVHPVNRAANHEALERRHSAGPVGVIYASDGPFDPDHMRTKIVGTVAGVLVPTYRAEGV